jgi:hypothetical protein
MCPPTRQHPCCCGTVEDWDQATHGQQVQQGVGVGVTGNDLNNKRLRINNEDGRNNNNTMGEMLKSCSNNSMWNNNNNSNKTTLFQPNNNNTTTMTPSSSTHPYVPTLACPTLTWSMNPQWLDIVRMNLAMQQQKQQQQQNLQHPIFHPFIPSLVLPNNNNNTLQQQQQPSLSSSMMKTNSNISTNIPPFSNINTNQQPIKTTSSSLSIQPVITTSTTNKRKRPSYRKQRGEDLDDDYSSETNDSISGPTTSTSTSKRHQEKLEFDGERRLNITFQSHGTLGKGSQPAYFGKNRLILPDGLCGKFTALGQTWTTQINHEEYFGDHKENVRVKYSITNSNGVVHSHTETMADALRRSRGGRTFCNRVFREAVELRKKELMNELARLPPNEVSASRSCLEGAVQLLSTTRVSEGPLFFGLRHGMIQEEMAKLQAKRILEENKQQQQQHEITGDQNYRTNHTTFDNVSTSSSSSPITLLPVSPITSPSS